MEERQQEAFHSFLIPKLSVWGHVMNSNLEATFIYLFIYYLSSFL
jgi:hypothetical protein